MDEEYPKSYKGFVIWLIAFIAAIIVLPLLPLPDNLNITTLLINNIMTVSIAVLTWMIYKNEKIYWYTGIEYEDAKKAGSEKRKLYALRHFKRFALFAAVNLVYSIVAYYADIPVAFSITFASLGIVAAAISTIRIKLE